MSRRWVVNMVAGMVVLAMLWLMARSMNYAPERVPGRNAPAAGEIAAPPTDDTYDAGGAEDAASPIPAPGSDLASLAADVRHAEIGFRSAEHLAEHFEKHGAEFDAPSAEAYLLRAQALRDRPVGGDVLEAVRKDGVVTRFDRGSGAFLAFDRDLVIRTFFRPNDGEAYFRRQLDREH